MTEFWVFSPLKVSSKSESRFLGKLGCALGIGRKPPMSRWVYALKNSELWCRIYWNWSNFCDWKFNKLVWKVHTLQIMLQYVLIIHWNFFIDFLEKYGQKYNNHGFGLHTLFWYLKLSGIWGASCGGSFHKTYTARSFFIAPIFFINCGFHFRLITCAICA
jgi:hypothetical protein